MIRLALPSDGELHETSLTFLASAGLSVHRPSARRYTGTIPALPGTTVLFQRSQDITGKVEEGSADLGICGLDRYLEYHREEGGALLVLEDLGYGGCDLVVAVPDSWVDVSTMDDLADVALEFRQRGAQLRIVTKYFRLVQRFFLAHGINYFSLISSTGALEAAPAAGYGDIIVDISATGTTLRENRLKTLDDGVVLSSQACLVGNRRRLADPEVLDKTRSMLEMMEGYLRARSFCRLTANVRADSPDEVAGIILSRPELSGLQGPTVSQVYSASHETWYSVSLVVARDKLLEEVEHLRNAGATDIFVSQVNYLFQKRCRAYERLLSLLGKA